MGYVSGKTYYIVPVSNQNIALSVSGNTQVSQNRNVILWSKQTISDQQWRVDVDTAGGFARIKSAINNAYALNVYLSTNNCDIYTWASNTNDSKINFRTINGDANTYYIQNYRNNADNNLYLTAESLASGANVKWAAKTGSANQQWKLIEVTGGGDTTTGNYAVYPTHVMNISQRHDDSYSHGVNNNSTSGTYKDYPIDEMCGDTGRSYMYCPCDEMEIKRIYGVGTSGTNTIWLRSTSPVKMPFSSTKQYLVMMVIHPNDDTLNGLSVGQKFTRNQAMFLEGNDGNASGYHFHISCGTGDLGNSGKGWIQNGNGSWVLCVTGQTLLPTQAFYRDASITTIGTIYGQNGYSFTTKP